ncbi:murein biosynthesis integral membrane protein MurJ [Microvirga brassicacearum]|uniref:Probable lipid II flippase MurJ n=1 Tax=Microvirga brassicacearum TaxID=2580413 RepID=A0A5N3PDY8_9HYPH|nr:murein biosynthesis integral membrane protein MurJ [Microvirga brassicacearum]KAB0267931.1 murein biosynthesis integral membrane protein MurJ [Microvirga brassicacearum]
MSVIRSSLLVGLGAGASRVLGFVRDVLFAQALGAGPVADAFLAAFRLPNLMRRVVGEGGLNPALVPVLGALEADAAAKTAGDVVTVFALALLGVTGLVELGAGLLAFALAPGFAGEPQTLDLVALYTRLAFPAVICITLASIGAALLNLHRRYTAASLAPLAMNGGLILAVVLLETHFPLPLVQKAAWLAAASSLAGVVQLAIVILALARGEASIVRFRKPVWSPALKSLLLAGFPALVASGAVQLFVLVGTQVASFWPSGVSWLYYADRVVQLPLGLMAALASSVLLPELALRYRAGERQALVDSQNRAIGLGLLLSLPASVALACLAEPMAFVLFRRGAFDDADAAGTALVLLGLSLGLPAATLAKVFSQALFARGALKGAVAAALIGMAATGLSSVLLGFAWGVVGIALGISLGCLAHAAVLVWLLQQARMWRPDRALLGKALRIALASALLGGGLLMGLRVSPAPTAVSLAVLCLGGLGFYAATAWLLGAVTWRDLAPPVKKA